MAIGIAVGFLVLSLVVMAVWFAKKHKKRTGSNPRYTMPSPFASSQNSGNTVNMHNNNYFIFLLGC